MKALRYFFCVVLPPVAILMTGRMGSFLLSLLLTSARLDSRRHSRLPGGHRLPRRATRKDVAASLSGRSRGGQGAAQPAVPASPSLSASACSAAITPSITSSSGIPNSAAPRTMSSRFTARANALSFIFFFTEATSTS